MQDATRVDGTAFRAQFGEDRLLAAQFADLPRGCCVEVGANDGVSGSNTYYFEQLGWTCVLVEADPELVETCRVTRPRSEVMHCAAVAPGSTGEITFQVVDAAKGLSSIAPDPRTLELRLSESEHRRTRTITVPARTLDDILEQLRVGDIAFVTIDVEGFEHDVLQGFSLERWRPSVLIIENNRHFPDVRILRHLRDGGYGFVRRTGVNLWFAPVDPAYARSLGYQRDLALRLWLPQLVSMHRALAEAIVPLRRTAHDLARGTLARLGLLDAVKRGLRRSARD